MTSPQPVEPQDPVGATLVVAQETHAIQALSAQDSCVVGATLVVARETHGVEVPAKAGRSPAPTSPTRHRRVPRTFAARPRGGDSQGTNACETLAAQAGPGESANRLGFTLVEMMTALAIFGVIGLMATQILTGTIRVGETTRERGEALSDVQRAMDIIGRDIMQLTRRTVLDELGESTEPVVVSGTSLLELTRVGWQNPLGKPRSEVQRVAYVHRDDTLIRLFWPVLDRAPGSAPIAQILLKDVAEASFGVHDDRGERHGFWPLVTAEDETAPELAAVAMALRLERYGYVERLWLVVPGASYLADAEAGDDPDAGEAEAERFRS